MSLGLSLTAQFPFIQRRPPPPLTPQDRLAMARAVYVGQPTWEHLSAYVRAEADAETRLVAVETFLAAALGHLARDALYDRERFAPLHQEEVKSRIAAEFAFADPLFRDEFRNSPESYDAGVLANLETINAVLGWRSEYDYTRIVVQLGVERLNGILDMPHARLNGDVVEVATTFMLGLLAKQRGSLDLWERTRHVADRLAARRSAAGFKRSELETLRDALVQTDTTRALTVQQMLSSLPL